MKKGRIKKRLLTLVLTFAMIIEGAGFMQYPVFAAETGEEDLLIVEDVAPEGEPGEAFNDGATEDSILDQTEPEDDKTSDETAKEPENEPQETAPEEVPMPNDGEESGDYTYTVNDGKATITKYNGTATSVSVPGTIDSYTVTEIGGSAFSGNKTIESVGLPGSVTKIGGYAFSNCSSLTSVTLPSGLTEIEYYAFYNCGLTSVTLPNGLEKIGSSAFYNCPIDSITIPASVTNISSGSFNKVKSASFGTGTTEIPSYVFQNASSLETVTIPSTVTKIGSYAFYGCSSLTSVTLPAGLTEIGYNAFYNCGLTSVTLPDTLETIGSSAFYNCPIDSITIPASVTSINSGAFNKVKSASFGTGITEIPSSVLQGAASLETVTIPSTVTKIGSYAFYGCSSLSSVTLPAGLTEIEYDAFGNCGLTSVTLPDTLETIGSSAFYNCPIDSITIPASVTSIGSGAFNKVKNASFGTGITEIPASVFQSASSLEAVNIPSTVTKIGGYAFSNCSSLTSVTLPAGLTEIEYDAFYYCTGLTNIVLPASLTEIGSYSFYYCKALKEVTIPAGTNVDYSAFEGCESLEKLTIGNGATIGRYAFRNCKKIKELEIGDNVTLDPTCFEGLSITGAIEGTNISYELTIADGLLTVKGTGSIPGFTDAAPAPWAGMSSKILGIKIEEGITSIGENAFTNLTKAKNVSLPESVTTIGKSAFKGCTSLSYLEFPKGVKTIEENAFANCTAVKEMVFCGDAPSINSKAFAGAIKSSVYAYFPQTATGWSKSRYQSLSTLIEWETWDNTQDTKDIVLVLDHSGSMSGKMERLHEAAATFVNGVGGRRQNARIAVVQYDDTAELLCDFSSDCSTIISKIRTLQASGGTEYHTALSAAEDVIKNSNADKKSMIMFSDGQPNDNQDKIFEKAAELQKSYTMYSVGLMSSSGSTYEDSYREILIKVAGSKKRYFEAEDIDALLQAFLNLQKDLGRQDQTTVDVLRHNVHHDLLNDFIEITRGSNEEIVLTILPGLELGDFDRVVLMQDEKEIVSSDSGRFTIMPGQLFVADSPIYAVTYDIYGNILEKKRIGLNIIQEYLITYYMNDGTTAIHQVDTLIGGQEILPPSDPERDGYKFMGWYTTQDASGFDFFSWYNAYNRKKVEADLNLYAHWIEQSSTLNPDKDIWKFGNSHSSFGYGDYEISSGDYSRLLESTEDEVTKYFIRSSKNARWGGSCFGMSSTVVLNRQGQINITEFDPSSLYVRQANIINNSFGDLDVGNVESMINFYQLRQNVGAINMALGNYNRSDESANIAAIVSKLRNAGSPCVLIINLYNGGAIAGGHAVVAYDFADMPDGSSEFKVYDCSMGPDKIYTIKVTNNGSAYSANLGSWPSDWGYTIFLRSALDDQDLISEAYLTKPSFSFQPDRGEDDFIAFIETSYGDYTISDGTDSAEFKNGLKISGTLNSNGYGLISEVDADPCYQADIVLEEGKTYTITPGSGSGKFDTDIYSYEEDGFFINSSSASPVTVAFDKSGKIKTSATGSAYQEVGAGINGMTTPWYHVDVESTSTGIEMKPAKDKVEIASASTVSSNIIVSSDFNEYKFENIGLNSNGVTVKEEGGRTVIVANGDVRASTDYGYSVVFDSRLGTSIEPLTGVKKGSKIEEPVDPQRPGFLFTGWYKDGDCRIAWNFDTDTVQNDTILYAGWSLDENYFLIVNFRIKGDDSQLLYIQKGTKLDINSCPTGEDGNALKWYADEECTVEWNFDTVLEKNTELYSPDWNAGRKTIGDVPSDEVPEGGIPDGIWIGGMENPEFTGKPVKPSFHVYDGSRLLSEKNDYSVTLKNNTNAYNVPATMTDADKKKAPSVTITMKGNYTGAETAYFSILPRNINNREFTVDELSAMYTGSSQKPKTLKLYRNGKALSRGKDYNIDFGTDDFVGKASSDTTYTINIEGIGNYSGTRPVKFTVYGKTNAAGKDQISINDKKVLVAKIPDQTYKGSAFTADTLKDKGGNKIVLLKYNGSELKEGVDYTASFSDAKNPGTATVTFTGLAGKSSEASVSLAGTRKITFKIIGAPIGKAAVEGLDKAGYEYTGQAIKPNVYLKGVDSGDYSVQFENNVNAGTATVLFTGKNGYTGTKKATFSIKKVKMTGSNVKVNNGVTVSVPYEKGGVTPSVTVTCGGHTLKEGRDYKIKLKNNKKPAPYNAARKKGPVLTISGLGNYTGSVDVPFTITKATMNKRVNISVEDVVYSPKAGKYMAKYTVTDVNGKKLKAGTDFSKTIYYYSVTTSSSGYESTSSLDKKSAPVAGTKIRMTITGAGTFYTGQASADYYIISPEKDLSKAKITVKDQAYTGKSITLNSADQFVTLTDAKGNPLKFGSADPAEDDFEVISYKNNINKGKATAVLKGKGDGLNGFAGTKTITFNIGTKSLSSFWKGWFARKK